jgi:hypothetical protein
VKVSARSIIVVFDMAWPVRAATVLWVLALARSATASMLPKGSVAAKT